MFIEKDENIDVSYLITSVIGGDKVKLYLKECNVSVKQIVTIPSICLSLRNSCYVCCRMHNLTPEGEFCVVVTSNDKIEKVTDSLLGCHCTFQIICNAKRNMKAMCPSLRDQKLQELKIKSNLKNVIENMFSDSDIFNNLDLLISMDDCGWVPVETLYRKIIELVSISNDELRNVLEKCDLLVMDESGEFIRRCNPILPYSDVENWLLLYNVNGLFKNALKEYPEIKEEAFDKNTKSCLVSVNKSKTEDFLKFIYHNEDIKGKLVVPRINVDDQHTPKLQDNYDQLLCCIEALTIKKDDTEKPHVRRLFPNELNYEFPEEFVIPNEDIINNIVNQCNFYFSDNNVLKDLFILQLIKKNPFGWVDIKIISNFKLMLKYSSNDINIFIYSMCFSDEVEINRNATHLRRRLPLPSWDSSVYSRTLFIWNIPSNYDSYSKIEHVLKTELRFNVVMTRYISSQHAVPADLRRLTTVVPALGTIDCAVVEFRERDAAVNASDYIKFKWPYAETRFLKMQNNMPVPAAIIGKSIRELPNPIPIADDFYNDCVLDINPIQATTCADPRLKEVKKIYYQNKKNNTPTFKENDFPVCSRNHNNKEKYGDYGNDDKFKNKSNRNGEKKSALREKNAKVQKPTYATMLNKPLVDKNNNDESPISAVDKNNNCIIKAVDKTKQISNGDMKNNKNEKIQSNECNMKSEENAFIPVLQKNKKRNSKKNYVCNA